MVDTEQVLFNSLLFQTGKYFSIGSRNFTLQELSAYVLGHLKADEVKRDEGDVKQIEIEVNTSERNDTKFVTVGNKSQPSRTNQSSTLESRFEK